MLGEENALQLMFWHKLQSAEFLSQLPNCDRFVFYLAKIARYGQKYNVFFFAEPSRDRAIRQFYCD